MHAVGLDQSLFI